MDLVSTRHVTCQVDSEVELRGWPSALRGLRIDGIVFQFGFRAEKFRCDFPNRRPLVVHVGLHLAQE